MVFKSYLSSVFVWFLAGGDCQRDAALLQHVFNIGYTCDDDSDLDDFISDVLYAIYIAFAVIFNRVLRVALGLPWSLARGDNHSNLKEFLTSVLPQTADAVSRKLYNLVICRRTGMSMYRLTLRLFALMVLFTLAAIGSTCNEKFLRYEGFSQCHTHTHSDVFQFLSVALLHGWMFAARVVQPCKIESELHC